MAERQAYGIDINFWSRTGGVNYPLVRQHLQNGVYDFLITEAGIGNWRSPLLAEHQQQAEKFGIPLVTYHLINPKDDLRQQARNYINWVGTSDTVYILDIESPSGNAAKDPPPNRSQLLRNIDELVSLTHKQPILYSTYFILNELPFLDLARNFFLWIAQSRTTPRSRRPHRTSQGRRITISMTLSAIMPT
jgi:GH25 family lysozyme M1 (1,4-beta-N-acetylmuramidase)